MRHMKYKGLYIELDKQQERVWSEKFKVRNIQLVPVENMAVGYIRKQITKAFDFYLFDEMLLLDSQYDTICNSLKDTPLFVLSEYVSNELMERCLALKTKGCFAKDQNIESVISRVLGCLETRSQEPKNLDTYYPTWAEVRSSFGIDHPSELHDFHILKNMIFREFLRSSGNMSKLAAILEVTRVTARKYYTNCQRLIFSKIAIFIIEDIEFGIKDIDRQDVLKLMKKKWFYSDFKKYIDIYNGQSWHISSVLMIPEQTIKKFIAFWDDIMTA